MIYRRQTLLAAVAVTVATPASAVPLVPGALTVLPGVTAAADPTLAGLVLADRLVSYSGTLDGAPLSGVVQQRVVRSDDTGFLDFYWRVTVDPSSAGDFHAFRVGGFGDTILGGDWRIDGVGSVAPGSAFAFSDANLGFVNFNFDDDARAGDETRFFFLRTNATRFGETAFYDVSNLGSTELTGSTVTFGPAAVPEPATWAMTIAGFAVVGLAARRRGRLQVSTTA